MARVTYSHFVLTGLAIVVAGGSPAGAATYDVGPGKALASIGEVPWESLVAGDLVQIHYMSEPYREKWVICRQGSSNAPIFIRGMPGPNGELPVIDGQGATTRLPLDYWGENRGVIKIGGASRPADAMPMHVVIENLEIRGARSGVTFTDDAGATQTYRIDAAAIYVEKGEQITIRNCVLRDCGNGLFISSGDPDVSRNFVIEGNWIYGNGNDASLYEHNVYTEGIGITFQYNRFGALRAGALGNNLKDRSAGLVVRYNWIEGGSRQLDLVDADSAPVLQDPGYRGTHVYGNVLIEPNGAGNKQILQYGGDSGNSAAYRKGTLYFYNNTVVSQRTDGTTVFKLSTNEESCQAFNNVLYVTAAGSTLAMLDDAGALTVRYNWMKSGWKQSFITPSGTVVAQDNVIGVAGPGFLDESAQDYRLTALSACLDAGITPQVTSEMELTREYAKHQSGQDRVSSGAPDLGAFEFSRLEDWRRTRFGADAGTALIAGDQADPDGDTLINLVEYALGLDPLNVSVPPAPLLVSGTDGAHYLGVTFTRRLPPAEVTYTVETSGDMAAWIHGAQYADDFETPVTALTAEMGRTGVNPLQITVGCTTPVQGENRRFIRLRISRP